MELIWIHHVHTYTSYELDNSRIIINFFSYLMHMLFRYALTKLVVAVYSRYIFYCCRQIFSCWHVFIYSFI